LLGILARQASGLLEKDDRGEDVSRICSYDAVFLKLSDESSNGALIHHGNDDR